MSCSVDSLLSQFEEYSDPSIVVDLLLERNVVNVSEIETYIEQFLGDQAVRDRRIRRWYQTVGRKFLINEFSRVQQLTEPSSGDPDWLRKAIEQGEEVYRVELDQELYRTFQDFLEYFRYGADEGELNRVTRMSWDELFEKWAEWKEQDTKEKQEKKRAAQAAAHEETVKTYGDGYAWVKLTGQPALQYEGERMSHSVGQHGPAVLDGREVIYSLRTPDNKPVVTLETSPEEKVVRQVKGKYNDPPPGDQISRIEAFIRKDLGYVVVGDRNHLFLGPLSIDFEVIISEPLPERQDRKKTYRMSHDPDFVELSYFPPKTLEGSIRIEPGPGESVGKSYVFDVVYNALDYFLEDYYGAQMIRGTEIKEIIVDPFWQSGYWIEKL